MSSAWRRSRRRCSPPPESPARRVDLDVLLRAVHRVRAMPRPDPSGMHRPLDPETPDDDVSSDRERESTMLRAAMTADLAARPSQASAVDDEPARVLVADDDAPTRELIASTL